MRNFSKKFLPVFALLGFHQLIYATTATDIAAFKQTWLAHALKLQREIDLNVPLNKATFLATHNSYNSYAYQIPVVRYIDPNQKLSIYDQLEAGVRGIELDAHWTFDTYFSKDILLCHGKDNHLGCSVFDRKMTEGLQEIRRWLKENPNEIVLLYIERHLNGHEPRLAAALDLNLGEFIFKPDSVRDPNDDPKSCVSMPANISKADILKAGKQLLIVTKGCDGANPKYEERGKFHQVWNDFVFAGIANMPPDDPFDFLEERPKDFSGYPDCGRHDNFSPDAKHLSIWRIYEDRTIHNNLPLPQKKVDQYTMREMVACGINWQTLDMLTVGDLRLEAAVWSWAPGYPKDGGGECAVFRNDAGIINVPCSANVTAVACENEKTDEVEAVNADGQFMNGETTCESKGKDWHFAVPINGRQMDELLDSTQSLATKQVWLNYKMDGNGNWVPNTEK